ARVLGPWSGSYVELTRTWKTGDTIELVLPKTLHLEPLADNPNKTAIMWGRSSSPAILDRNRRAPFRGPPAEKAGARPGRKWMCPYWSRPGATRLTGWRWPPEHP